MLLHLHLARAGTYLLNVTWAGRLVKECPLKVVVEPPSNASKVVCSGEGLRAGTMGKEIKCVIDTRWEGNTLFLDFFLFLTC